MSARWASKCIWKVEESIGASDHLPITTTVQHVCLFQPVLPPAAKSKQSGVDCTAFAAEVDRTLRESDPSPILAVRVANFVAALKLAVKRVVGKTKPERKNRVQINVHVRAIIRKRNRLSKDIGVKREEWKAACQEVTEAIIEATQVAGTNSLPALFSTKTLPRSGPLSVL